MSSTSGNCHLTEVAHLGGSDGIESVKLRRVRPDLGFVDVRMSHVNLIGLRVTPDAARSLALTPPTTKRNGRLVSCFSFTPAAWAAVERAIAHLWSLTDA